MQDLTAAVAAETSVQQSVITMLNGLVAQLKAAMTTTPQVASPELDAVVASIQANTKALQDAVTANTPAVPHV